MQIDWLGICAEVMMDYLDQIYDGDEMVKKFQDIAASAFSVADYMSVSEKIAEQAQAATLLSSGLGLLLQETFQYRISLQAYQKAISIKHNYGEQNCFVEHFNIGKLLNELEDFDGAIKHYTRCIRALQRNRGNHNMSLINFYIEIAGCYSQQDNYSKAIQNCLTCIDVLAKCDNSINGYHAHAFEIYISLAEIYYLYGEYKETARFSIRALRLCRSNFERNDYYYLAQCRVFLGIAKIYTQIDDYDRALRWLNKALVMYNRFDDSFSGIAEQRARVYDLMGSVYKTQSKFDKALDCYQIVLSTQKALRSEVSPEAALAMNNIGCVYGEMGDWKKAFDQYDTALELLTHCFGANHTDTMLIYHNMAHDHCTKNDYEQSVSLLNKVIDYFSDKCGGYNSNLADAYLNMARTLRCSGRLDEALDYSRKALHIQEHIFFDFHPDIGLTCKGIADILFELENKGAEDFYLQARDVYEKALGKNSRKVHSINEQIAKCRSVLQ